MKRKRVILYSKNESAQLSGSPEQSLSLLSPSKKLKSKELSSKSESVPFSHVIPEAPLDSSIAQYYTVLWANRSNKKHKTYKDGYGAVKDGKFVVYDDSNKQIASSKLNKDIEIGIESIIADKEIIVSEIMSKSEFELKRRGTASEHQVATKPSPITFKKDTLHKMTHPIAKKKLKPTPKYDPFAANAVILYNPEKESEELVHVVLEPYLSDKMRPHQIEGVKFMYECVTGLRKLSDESPTKGCILADVMGIGKTFQAISLIRTLLTQSPQGFKKPHITKAIIIAPASLVKQWSKEINKWLGNERLKPVLIGEDNKKQTKQKLETFLHTHIEPLLIISYEQLRIHIEIISQIKFGIMICDEGHRLKNPDSKTTQSLNSIPCDHRVVLTGTPFQNNFNEYFTLIDFVNPNCLGSLESFRRTYVKPIAKSKEPDASEMEKRIGTEKSQELKSITSSFILRRTSKVLEKFLPPKIEQVILCRPTPTQIEIYNALIESVDIDAIYSKNGCNPLVIMTQLAKICNHPELLLPKNLQQELSIEQERVLNVIQSTGCSRGEYATKLSGKLIVLEQLISKIKSSTKDKIVIASSFTKSLDIIQRIFTSRDWSYQRLDGQTDITARQHAVDIFQKDSECFAFLLSTKAGAVGLNLFSANRLILFDGEWNPSFDIQAQARIWRDGQTKTTYIYKLLSTGMIDEKIFQRQLVKTDLSKLVIEKGTEIDSEMLSSGFSKEEIKRIFHFNPDTNCDTHDISGCQCCGDNQSQLVHQLEIKDYFHFRDPLQTEDPILKSIEASKKENLTTDEIEKLRNIISFVFYKETKPMDM